MIHDVIPAAVAVLSLFSVYALFPTWYYLFFKKLPFCHSENEKKILLSFDDGPDPRYTVGLLKILADNEVRAVFFVVAEKAAQNPEIIQMISEGGHLIGLHSLEHRDAWREGIACQKKDFEQGLSILQGLGCKVTFYRAPWGHLNMTSLLLASKHKLKIVMWTVMAQDWEPESSSARILERLTGRTKSGSVICLHDSGCGKRAAPGAPECTLKAVEEYVPLMLKNGYSFVLPDDCH